MPKGRSGAGKGGAKKGSASGASATTAAPDGTVRGVLQSEIDKLRGERDHQGGGSITWQTIQDDYKRVGITITEQEARDIRQAVSDYTYLYDTPMRKAMVKSLAGRPLTPNEQDLLNRYKLVEEYCKVAPLLPSGKYKAVYRGIKYSTITPEYTQKILDLRPGDKWDVDRMPTSFTTRRSTAETFSIGNSGKGIIVHMPVAGMKNTPSMRGISHFPGENEVFVADYNWQVSKVVNHQSSNDGYYHIYMKKP